MIDKYYSRFGFSQELAGKASVKGIFKEYDSSIYTTDENFLTAEIDCWVNPWSAVTDSSLVNNILTGVDITKKRKIREIEFRSQKIEPGIHPRQFILLGDLLMGEEVAQIKLEAELEGLSTDISGNRVAGFLLKGSFDLITWGIDPDTFWGADGVTTGSIFSIDCTIQLVRLKEVEER